MLKLDFILQWAATVFTIGGAIAAACAIFPLNIWLFNIGSAFWLAWSVRQRTTSVVVVNAGLLLVYTVGVLHEFLK